MNDTIDENAALLEILKEAISIEILGKEYYSVFIEHVSDKHAKAIFKGLLWDEDEHLEILKDEYKKLSGEPVDLEVLRAENREKAKQMFPESASLSITEIKDVLIKGIRTEERSIGFYSLSAQKTGNKAVKDLLLRLVGLEDGHKGRLEGILHYLEQEGSLYGYSSFYTRWILSGLSSRPV